MPSRGRAPFFLAVAKRHFQSLQLVLDVETCYSEGRQAIRRWHIPRRFIMVHHHG